jgi:uncharacterized protein involved in exopolysaccharide biosynthesis
MTDNISAHREGSIGLIEIIRVLSRGRWWLIGITTISVALGAAYCLAVKPWYRADVLLKLADTKSTQGLSSSLGALGGLASLAGITVGNTTSSEPIAVLTSREFVGDFIKDQDLLPLFFPGKWDASAHRWKTSAVEDQPDVRDGVRYFEKKIVHVVEDRKTSLITLSIDWKDPVKAAEWANVLVARVNENMRLRAAGEAQSNVNYLKHEMATSNLVPLQESIGRLLETELQRLMLASLSKEYAFRIIDHAQVPKWRYRPLPLVVIPGAFVLGLALSVIFLLGRDAVKRYRSALPPPRDGS